MSRPTISPAQTRSSAAELPLVPPSGQTNRAAIGFDSVTLMRISRMAFGHPWRMAIALVATVVAAVSQLISPQLIGAAIDEAHGLFAGAAVDQETARAALLYWAMLLLVASVVRGLATMMQNYQGEAVGHLIGYELRLAYYAKLQRLSFSYHDRIHTGELITRGMLDVEGVRMWVHTGILRVYISSGCIPGAGCALGPCMWRTPGTPPPLGQRSSRPPLATLSAAAPLLYRRIH